MDHPPTLRIAVVDSMTADDPQAPMFPTDAITLSDRVPMLSGLVFFHEPHTGGRPAGSGTWGTPAKYLAIVRPILWEFFRTGREPTVKAVLAFLPKGVEPCTEGHFYRSTAKHTGMPWKKFVPHAYAEFMSGLCQK